MSSTFTDPNFYDYLQISEQAEKEVIVAAYRKLAQKYHPDSNPSKEAEEKMKKINMAYETLSDDDKRKKYDTWLILYRTSQKHRNNSDYKNNYKEQRAENKSNNDSEYKDLLNIDMIFQSAKKRCSEWETEQQSIFLLEEKIKKKQNRRQTIHLAICVIFIACIGIYLFNSGKFQNVTDSFSAKNENEDKMKNKTSEQSSSQTETNNDEETQTDNATVATQYKVTATTLKIRSSTDTSNDNNVITKLSANTILEGTGNTVDGWIEVKVPDSDNTGWVSQEFVEIVTEAGDNQSTSTSQEAESNVDDTYEEDYNQWYEEQSAALLNQYKEQSAAMQKQYEEQSAAMQKQYEEQSAAMQN